MSRVTAIAPSNIAFVKYWGASDLERALPVNQSLSMTLSRCVTRTTVERLDGGEDTVLVRSSAGELLPASAAFTAGVERHLAALRHELEVEGAFRIATENTFPSSAGIASSASGFTALAIAVCGSLGIEPEPRDLSRLARASGSGSAARSVVGGYVVWPGDPEDSGSPMRQVATARHWELCDVVTVVDTTAKPVPSREGHRRAASSPYFSRRLEQLPGRLQAASQAVLDRDLARLGPIVETEAIDLHLIAMSSVPPIFYWRPQTLEVLERVWALRDEGVEVWATLDAGPNLHLICEPESEPTVVEAIGRLPGVRTLIRDRVGSGPARSEEHLF
ncbi:MAG: diphosphomevalonate decarboxylase [Thermoanaerobaculia bacterium]|nr:diphosphomevalonate decarboxylase [Thermoanaerobaculia bacterium]